MTHISKVFKTKVFEWVKDGDRDPLQDYVTVNLNSHRPSIKIMFSWRDQNNRTILHWASFLGQIDLLNWWIQDYSDLLEVQQKDHEGYSPLELACVRGYTDDYEATSQFKVVQLLLNHGANLVSTHHHRPGPLHWAFYYSNRELILLLILKNFYLLLSQNQTTGEYPIDYLFLEHKPDRFKENQEEIFKAVVELYFFRSKSTHISRVPTPQNSRLQISLKLPKIEVHQPSEKFEIKPSESIEQEPHAMYKPHEYSYEIKRRSDQVVDRSIRSKMSQVSNPISMHRQYKEARQVQQNIQDNSRSMSSYNSEPEEEKIPQVQFAPAPSPSPLKSDYGEEKAEGQVTAPLKQFDKQASAQSQNQPIFVIYHLRKSMPKQAHLDTRLMFWATQLGLSYLVRVFIDRKCSPFMVDYHGMNALHCSAYHGRLNVMTLILEADYTYYEAQELLQAKRLQKKLIMEHTFNKKIVLNKHTKELPSTALHLAIEQENYDCMKLLVEHKADTDLINFRTLKPFELTYNDNILQFYKDFIKPVKDEFNFGDQNYIYVLETPAHSNIEQDIVFLQLQNIQKAFKKLEVEKKWKFEFIVLFGPDLDHLENYTLQIQSGKPPKPKRFYYVIRLNPTTIYQLAELHQIQCYNLKKKYICTFKYSEHMFFEYPRDLQVHDLIMKTLNQEFDVDKFLLEKLIISHFPLEDHAKSNKISAFWKEEQTNCIQDSVRIETDQNALRPLHTIAMYYGPVIGWYFAFLVQLVGWLQAPSILGVALGLYMIITGDSQQQITRQYNRTAITPVYALFMALWSTLFLEKWKRRESELRFCWDMHNYKAREPERVMYTGTFTLNPITKSVMMFDSFTTFKRRLIAELPIILFGFAIVALVFYTFFLWSRMYKGNQIMGIVIGSLNGATITIMSTLYKVQYLSDHSSFVNVSYNGRIIDLIVNIYLFEFVNSYATVVYYGVIEGDAALLSSTVGSIVITRGVIQNLMSNVIPYISYSIMHRIFVRKFNTFKQIYLQRQNKQKLPQICCMDYISDGLKHRQQLALLEQLEETNVRQPSKLLFDEYTSIAIQFGYVTMFAPSFPAAPVFVMISCFFNLRFSVYNYQKVMKREINLPADSIGIWLDIFSIMNYAATFMNCLVIYTTNYPQMAKLIGASGEPGIELALILVITEHIMIIVKFVLQILIDDSPQWVELGLRRYEYLESKNDFQ